MKTGQSVTAAQSPWRIDRRDFLRVSTGTLAALSAACATGWPRGARANLRFGMLTDPHYADADPVGTRYYRESIDKVREAVALLNRERVVFLAELGDLKDMAPLESDTRTLAHLTTIEAEIARFRGPTYHVLGNHDMDNLSKRQFLARVTNTGIGPDRAYYAFTSGGIRFVVLDACVSKDGKDYDHGQFDWRDSCVPASQLGWLRGELAASRLPVIVFCHQRLDGTRDECVRNAEEVRAVLEASRKVLVAFHGHDHPGGQSLINGIHYYTLRAIVEGSGADQNAYAIVEVRPDLNITITGLRRAVSANLGHGVVTAGQA